MKRKIFIIGPIVFCFTVIAAFFISSCNTVHGFGQDMEAGGKSLQKTSTEPNSSASTKSDTN
jgi:predicted small secreted protein